MFYLKDKNRLKKPLKKLKKTLKKVFYLKTFYFDYQTVKSVLLKYIQLKFNYFIKSCTFEITVLATLPVRSASQGESFAFNTFILKNNTPPMPLKEAHSGGFFF